MTRMALCVVVALALAAVAQAQVDLGNPLAGLEQLKHFEAERASSSDPNWQSGNGDARPIAPGGTLTLAELEGPGMIGHIWCTIAHAAAQYSRLLTLRIYWDGEAHPSVECPIGDFFVMGHGIDKPFWSIPVRVSSEGRGRNCYWPMPFRKSAKITVTNESDKPCHAFYYYIDWQKHESLPADTAYFHAMYRQEFPCVMGRNYEIADIRGRGHYVGTVQSVYMVSPGWYGEGDDFFFIDGEREPRLRGTGTEDYFCDGWGFRQFDGPFYGAPLWEGFDTGDRGTVYRFHITDPIPFRSSLWVEIEHKGSQGFPDGTGSGFIERDDLMSSVAFWYQTEPHKPWPALPPGPERLPIVDRTVCEGEDLIGGAKQSGAFPLELQPVGGTSGAGQLWFRPNSEGQWVDVTFDLAEPLTAELVFKVVHSHDYGLYAAILDGQEVAAWDMYEPTVEPTDHGIGIRTLAAGKHTVRFGNRGKNAKSTGYLFGFDALAARVPAYSRPPEVDLRTLQVEPAPSYVIGR